MCPCPRLISSPFGPPDPAPLPSPTLQLEKLAIIGEERSAQWIIGMDSLPAAWSHLVSLHTLELRGHQLLDM